MDALTLGVEEEYLVVDLDTRELAPTSHLLLPKAKAAVGDEVSPELNLCQIEIGTPVCTSLAEVRHHLERLRSELAAAASQLGLAIAATATHPFSPWEHQRIDTANDRYAQLDDRYQLVARQQVISGCHVHIGIDDPELAIAAQNRVRQWLPVLLALSGNSPFWKGMDTGYDSYRLELWRSWPLSGIPPQFEDRRHYDGMIHTLQSIDAIEDPTFLYWQVRPSVRYPTLEFRVTDVCAEVDDAVALAGLIRGLAWTALRDAGAGIDGLPATEVIEAAMWRAARFGVGGLLVSPETLTPRPGAAVVEELLAYVAEGLEAQGDRAEVVELVGRILEDGNGATRQRRALARRRAWPDVVDDIVARTVPAGGSPRGSR